MPEGVPRVAAIALDLRVLGAAAGLSLVTGLLFGIVPALQLSKPDLTNSLKDGTHGASAGRGRRAPAQHARRRRSRARRRAPRRGGTLHRQLHRADARRSGLQPRPCADDGYLLARRARPTAARSICRIRRDRRAPRQDPGRRPRVHEPRRGPVRHPHLDQQPDGSRQADRERPWRQHQNRDAGLSQSDWGFPSAAAGCSTRRTTPAARTR